VHFQIRLWFFTHQPLFPVLQISDANHAEMFPQDSRCAQEVIGVRVSGVATPFRTNRCRTNNGDRLWCVNCAGPKDGKSSAAGVTPNWRRIASNIEPRRRSSGP
jgi:hypothetical protein